MRYGRYRIGAVNQLLTFVITGALAIVVLIGLLVWFSNRGTGEGATELVMYCAAGMRVPVERIAAQYEEEHEVRIEIQYGGSNTLLSKLEVNRGGHGDLYLAGDAFYTDLAKEKGLAAESMAIAQMKPVIAVAKQDPPNIRSIEDLLGEDIRVALGNPDQAAIGKATREGLSVKKDDGRTLWDRLKEHVTRKGVFKPTVSEVANDLKIGAVDAVIIWDSTAALPQYRSHFDVINVAEFDKTTNLVTLAVLNSSKSATSALRFARYLTARDKGLPVFKEYGFNPIDGDLWAQRPEITFFCGAINRRAVDEVIKAFEQREGVKVNTVYNGCGILTAQMRTINRESGGKGFPDVYMACDRYYLENVKDWFQEDVDISDADIVIAVPRGNPKNIQTLSDLVKPGMRVSVGQPEQCTIGALTGTLLKQEGLYDRVMKNVVMQTASSAMLVPSVTTKSVDAAIAYITDTIAESDKVDAVRIASPYAKAVQPFSIARSSNHKYLGRRLFQAVADAREKFESAGFHFRLEQGYCVNQEVSEP
ncbi:MAG: substrate-binding domain-containing protein [Planctomycetota bacterium]